MRTAKEALREIRNRLVYLYGKIDGTFDPPALKEVCEIADEGLADKDASVCNAAAMREALELAIEVGDWCCAKTDDPLECCEYSCAYQVEPHGEASEDCPWKKIRAALSAPPRNCDVGTAEEQAKRFALHCDKHPKCNGCQCCGVIPLNKCELAWAQMPYDADAKKEERSDAE